MKKRIIAVILVAFMFIPMIAACGDKEDDLIEIVFSIWGNPEELVSTQAALDIYNALPGVEGRVKVSVIQIANEEYGSRLRTMKAGGNMPDCGMVDERTAIGWAREGLLLPIDIYAGQADQPLDYLRFVDGGKTVATSVANEVLAIWYNKDMFAAAGVAPPPTTLANAWTWDEFVNVAKQLTFDANGNTPNDAGFDRNNVVQYGAYVNQWAWQLEVWALSNGGRWYSADGKSIVFDDAAIDAIQKVYDLHLVHGVAPLNMATADNGFFESVGAGNVAMCTEGQWATGFANDEDFTINYGVGVLPYMQVKANICAGGPVAVFADTKHPDEVGEFLRWYADGDNNFGPIEAGWWMPNNMKWFTDEALLKKWIDDAPMRARLPASDYRTAIKDVAMDTNVTKSTGWYYAPNTDAIDRILIPALGEAINGSKTVKQVIEEVRPALEAALAG